MPAPKCNVLWRTPMSDMQALATPACFGAATVFSHDSDVCKGCAAFQSCSEQSLKTLESIRGSINVDDLIKRHMKAKRLTAKPSPPPSAPVERPLIESVERKTRVERVTMTVTEEEGDALATLPMKPKEACIRLIRAGLIDELRAGLPEKRNAFAQKGPSYLRVAVDMLLSGGFARKDFCDRLRSELGWSLGTAQSHASLAVVTLKTLKIAVEEGGRFVIAPNLT